MSRAVKKSVSLSTLRREAKSRGLDVDLRRPEEFARFWSIDVMSGEGVATIMVYHPRKAVCVNAAYAALKAIPR